MGAAGAEGGKLMGVSGMTGGGSMVIFCAPFVGWSVNTVSPWLLVYLYTVSALAL
jgi:hypothetical protein